MARLPRNNSGIVFYRDIAIETAPPPDIMPAGREGAATETSRSQAYLRNTYTYIENEPLDVLLLLLPPPSIPSSGEFKHLVS